MLVAHDFTHSWCRPSYEFDAIWTNFWNVFKNKLNKKVTRYLKIQMAAGAGYRLEVLSSIVSSYITASWWLVRSKISDTVARSRFYARVDGTLYKGLKVKDKSGVMKNPYTIRSFVRFTWGEKSWNIYLIQEDKLTPRFARLPTSVNVKASRSIVAKIYQYQNKVGISFFFNYCKTTTLWQLQSLIKKKTSEVLLI